MRSRRVRITVEKHEVLVRRHGGGSGSSWCEACRAEVNVLRPEEAAALAGVTVRTIYRRLDAGQVHFTESPDHAIWVCVKSLLK